MQAVSIGLTPLSYEKKDASVLVNLLLSDKSDAFQYLFVLPESRFVSYFDTSHCDLLNVIHNPNL